MAGPSGICYKREGTVAYFYSRKGAWKGGMTIHGMDPVDVIPGHKYEFDFDSDPSTITKDVGPHPFYQADLAQHGLNGVVPDNSQGPATITRDYLPGEAVPYKSLMHETVPMNGLMASATGVVKSMIEGPTECSIHEAMKAGIIWASLWGEVPKSASMYALASVKDIPNGEEPDKDPDDDIPF